MEPARALSAYPLPEIQQFLFDEARLLDTERFEDWLNLFTADGLYWVPGSRGQSDPRNAPSIIYEDRNLLTMRIKRLAHPRAFMMSPPPRATRMVGNIALARNGGTASEYHVASVLIVVEYHDEHRRLFSGQCSHVLRRVDETLRIASKRVDLVDCDAVHSAMMLPL
jgi:benzoate/toluate 1,2-dioxygenase beta subunit